MALKTRVDKTVATTTSKNVRARMFYSDNNVLHVIVHRHGQRHV